MSRVSLAVSHLPGAPGRDASMQRVRDALYPWNGPSTEMTDKAPNHVWSARMWQWAEDSGADWCLFAQDDVLFMPRFRDVLDAMLAARPHDLIAFEGTHPAIRPLAAEGHHWADDFGLRCRGPLRGSPRILDGVPGVASFVSRPWVGGQDHRGHTHWALLPLHESKRAPPHPRAS